MRSMSTAICWSSARRGRIAGWVRRADVSLVDSWYATWIYRVPNPVCPAHNIDSLCSLTKQIDIKQCTVTIEHGNSLSILVVSWVWFSFFLHFWLDYAYTRLYPLIFLLIDFLDCQEHPQTSVGEILYKKRELLVDACWSLVRCTLAPQVPLGYPPASYAGPYIGCFLG